MLTVPGSTYRNCDGLSRRNFLQVGAPLLGLGLSSLLEREATADDGTRDRGKSLIVFWTHGGMSQQDTYDMKPDSPAEYRGPYRPIKTNVPGTIVGERFARQARVMDKIAQVRSVHHENGIHAPSAHWMQTGYFGPTLARIAAQYPSFGSVINKALGARSPHMPAYIAVPKAEAFGYQKSVYLGASFDPFEVGADPNSKNFKVPNLALPGGLELANVRKRRDLLTRFDSLRRDIDRTGVMDGLDAFKAKALEMVTGEEVRKAFEIDSEPDALRARYGRHQYGQSALLARRLVEAGARVVTVNTGYWDHHNDVHPNLEQHLPPLDAAMATLIEELDERGMLDTTLVLVMGEFGRTPKITTLPGSKTPGRDHWSSAMSILVAGCGTPAGQIIGATDKNGYTAVESIYGPENLVSSIYLKLGIDPNTILYNRVGRPIHLVSDDRPIKELMG